MLGGLVYEINKIFSEKFIQIIPKIKRNFRIPPNLPKPPKTSPSRLTAHLQLQDLEINPKTKTTSPEK
jgi:hypothetical protein